MIEHFLIGSHCFTVQAAGFTGEDPLEYLMDPGGFWVGDHGTIASIKRKGSCAVGVPTTIPNFSIGLRHHTPIQLLPFSFTIESF